MSRSAALERQRGMSSTTSVDVAVVGAGLGGLAVANLVARAGHSVAVLDPRATGGRARSLDHDGFTLNEGPHALYRGGAAWSTLAVLGIDPSGGDPLLDSARVVANGVQHSLPVSPVQMLGSKVLSRRSKLVAAGVMSSLMKGQDKKAEGLSLADWFGRRKVPADLRSMIEMYVRLTTYCDVPERMSATAAISQFALAQQGVLYLDGGWQSIVDPLRESLRATGSALHEQVGVERVERAEGLWHVRTGVGVDTVARAIVLACGGPATAARLVGDDPGWVDAAGPAARVACLDLGVEVPPPVGVLLSMDAHVYGSSHAPPAQLAPTGRGLVGVMRYVRPDESHDRHSTQALLREHADAMGVEGIVFDRYLHDMTASYGTPLADRARPRGDELASSGCWAVGDWIERPATHGPVPLLADATLASASAAAGDLQRFLVA